jgi:hypothetical protein
MRPNTPLMTVEAMVRMPASIASATVRRAQPPRGDVAAPHPTWVMPDHPGGATIAP